MSHHVWRSGVAGAKAALHTGPLDHWGLVTLAVSAGALMVPLDPRWTPLAGVVGGLVGFGGILLWRWSGLPRIRRAGAAERINPMIRPVVWLILGSLLGLIVVGSIRLLIEPVLPAIGEKMAIAGTLPAWRRGIIIYVAAIGEELLFRLVLLSGLAGIIARLRSAGDGYPSPGIVWTANIVAALGFGAVHLPSWIAVGSVGPGLAVAVLGLNALGGLAFGWVFTNWGIVAAMWTHAGADCVVQFLGPLTGR